MTDSPPTGWYIKYNSGSTVINYIPFEKSASKPVLIANSLFSLLLVYGMFVFLRDWFWYKTEILPGGAVFFILLLGLFVFTLRNLSVLLRKSVYTLNNSYLEISEIRLFTQIKTSRIPKDRIFKILQLQTPARNTSGSDIWSTTVVYTGDNDKTRQASLEGYDLNESEFLTKILSNWSNIKSERQNTTI